jgi:hypothetical protein
MNSEQARQQAEAVFKRKEQAREGKKTMSEYKVKEQAMSEKSARLRALRLARDDAAKKMPLR